MSPGDATPEAEAEAPLLDDVVKGSIDFNGRPSRRSRSGGWSSVAFIIVMELAERFGFYGINSNLISYLTGPLGQSTAAAAANVNAWTGTAFLLPLAGAFVADSFWGRYRTIIVASLLFITGLGFLSLSAAVHSFNSSSCNLLANGSVCSPPLIEVVVFFFSLYLVALAEGGHRPCVQAFGADQYDGEDETESKTKSSFFNWWYFSMHWSSIIILLVMNYIQENLSWELGFGLPCIVMCVALAIFLLGSRRYRFHINRDEKNPFVRIGRVFVKAARNRNAATSAEEEALQTTNRSFLDRAIYTYDGSDVCSTRDVDDARAILQLLPIWGTCWGYAVLFSQLSTLFTKQGATMNRYIVHGFQIPAASLQSLMSLSIIVSIPIYDRVFVPAARAITKKPAGITMLQRIGAGLVMSLLTMVVAALVERRRLATAVDSGLVDEPSATLPMSVWWLAPQYLMFGVADVFVMIGLQEFFYDQVPGELKSIGLALFESIFGIGNFLSSFLISVIESITSRDGRDSWFSNNLNRAHLDYFYWLLAGVSGVTLLAFGCLAKSYVYKRKGMV